MEIETSNGNSSIYLRPPFPHPFFYPRGCSQSVFFHVKLLMDLPFIFKFKKHWWNKKWQNMQLIRGSSGVMTKCNIFEKLSHLWQETIRILETTNFSANQNWYLISTCSYELNIPWDLTYLGISQTKQTVQYSSLHLICLLSLISSFVSFKAKKVPLSLIHSFCTSVQWVWTSILQKAMILDPRSLTLRCYCL